jgi:transcriptional regulator with XRE-family HTH domain
VVSDKLFVAFLVGLEQLILMKRFDSEKAKELIKRRGRTRDWIAKFCGIEVKSLSNILNGKSPGRPTVKLLALALECDESDLYLQPPEKPRRRRQVAA